VNRAIMKVAMDLFFHSSSYHLVLDSLQLAAPKAATEVSSAGSFGSIPNANFLASIDLFV